MQNWLDGCLWSENIGDDLRDRGEQANDTESYAEDLRLPSHSVLQIISIGVGYVPLEV
jgi:hypothetical protein